MSIPSRPLVAAALVSLTLGLAAGCEDSDARTREEVQRKITSATESLERTRVNAGGDQESFNETRMRQLRDIIAELNGATGGTDGQDAARGLLTAMAFRELAALEAGEIEASMADHHRRRLLVAGKVAAALDLQSIAHGLESADNAEELDRLAGQLEQAQAGLQQLNDQMQQLSEPIDRLSAENAENLAQVDDLQAQANELLRQAIDRGPLEGLPAFIQAKSIESDAYALRFDVERNQISLDHDFTPRHRLAEERASGYQAQIEAIESSREDLTAAQQDAGRLASEVRADMQAVWRDARSEVDAIDSERGELDARCEQVASTLQQAVTAAEGASRKLRGEDADPARVAAARSYESIGRLHWNRARSLDSHVTLLASCLEAADAFGDRAGIEGMIETATQARAAAAESARAALQSASDALEQVGARGGRVDLDAFRSSLQSAIAMTGGDPIAPPPSTPSASSGRGPGAARGALELGGGAESPDALVAELSNVRGLEDLPRVMALNRPLDTIDGMSPALRALAAKLSELPPVLADLESAVKEAFGRSMTELDSTTHMMQTALPSSATIDVVAGDRGRIDIVMSDGGTRKEEIIRIGDRWYIDVKDPLNDNPFLSMEGPALASGPDLTTPEGREMMRSMMEGMSESFIQIVDLMMNVARELIGEIRSGELAAFEDVQTRAGEIAARLTEQMTPPGGGEGG